MGKRQRETSNMKKTHGTSPGLQRQAAKDMRGKDTWVSGDYRNVHCRSKAAIRSAVLSDLDQEKETTVAPFRWAIVPWEILFVLSSDFSHSLVGLISNQFFNARTYGQFFIGCSRWKANTLAFQNLTLTIKKLSNENVKNELVSSTKKFCSFVRSLGDKKTWYKQIIFTIM